MLPDDVLSSVSDCVNEFTYQIDDARDALKKYPQLFVDEAIAAILSEGSREVAERKEVDTAFESVNVDRKKSGRKKQGAAAHVPASTETGTRAHV